MSKNFLKDESRKNWFINNALNIEDIKTGAVLRIADSLEKIEKSYVKILNDLAFYKERYHRQQDEIDKLNHKVAGLKSYITRLNNKNKSKKGGDKLSKKNNP